MDQSSPHWTIGNISLQHLGNAGSLQRVVLHVQSNGTIGVYVFDPEVAHFEAREVKVKNSMIPGQFRLAIQP